MRPSLPEARAFSIREGFAYHRRMVRRIGAIVLLGLCGCVQPLVNAPRAEPKPATVNDSSVLGQWAGIYASGYGAYALNLAPDHRGAFAFVEGNSSASSYMVARWDLSSRRLNIDLQPRSAGAPPMSITADAFGAIMTLRVKTPAGTERQVDLHRAETVMPALQKVLDATR
jgi:hypothetical protein